MYIPNHLLITMTLIIIPTQSIGKVDKDKLIEAGRKYVLPLFGEKARSAVVCSSEKAEEIKSGLESMGLPLDVQVRTKYSIN